MWLVKAVISYGLCLDGGKELVMSEAWNWSSGR